MKKSTLILCGMLACSTIFFSCKKERNCKCSVTINFLGTTSSADSVIALGKVTKKDAKEKCDNYETDLKNTVQIVGGTGSCSVD